MNKICVVLLSGGIGSRMGSTTPKQYLELGNKPIAKYSFERFASMAEVCEIVVVCNSDYEELFAIHSSKHLLLTFARPGVRRQDSVYNGVQAIRSDADFICIHDAARPFITIASVEKLFEAAKVNGAAALGVKVTSTIKESDDLGYVVKTHPREYLWEIQTPQIIKKNLLLEGFALADKLQATVTDDVSLIELLNLPVKLVEGNYNNIKITTPEDLKLCQLICKD